jgi:hypothetical protein
MADRVAGANLWVGMVATTTPAAQRPIDPEFIALRRAICASERCLSRAWSDWFTRSAMPPMRVDGFHLFSVSKAQ